MNSARNTTLAGARFAASVQLSGVEIPECFAQATEASLDRARLHTRLADKRDARRLAAKTTKIAFARKG